MSENLERTYFNYFIHQFEDDYKFRDNPEFGIDCMSKCSALLNHKDLVAFFKKLIKGHNDFKISDSKFSWKVFDDYKPNESNKNLQSPSEGWFVLKNFLKSIESLMNISSVSYKYLQADDLEAVLTPSHIKSFLKLECDIYGCDTYTNLKSFQVNIGKLFNEFYFQKELLFLPKIPSEHINTMRPTTKCKIRASNRASPEYRRWAKEIKIESFLYEMLNLHVKNISYIWVEDPNLAVFSNFFPFLLDLFEYGFFSLENIKFFLTNFEEAVRRIKNLEELLEKDETALNDENGTAFEKLLVGLRETSEKIVVQVIHLITDEILELKGHAHSSKHGHIFIKRSNKDEKTA